MEQGSISALSFSVWLALDLAEFLWGDQMMLVNPLPRSPVYLEKGGSGSPFMGDPCGDSMALPLSS